MDWSSTTDWYYRLLFIKGKVKTQDEFDASDIEEATKVSLHYESWNADKRQLPFAYYYLGRIYSCIDNMPMALEFYHKSLKNDSFR